jgi:hypothetical protein
MSRIAALVAAGLVLAAPAVAAQSPVQVNFIQPERYIDAALYGGYGEKAQAPALTGIRTHLEKLGQRYLKPDQTLTVDVLDIDLAGQFEPWRALSYDVRYLRDIT